MCNSKSDSCGLWSNGWALQAVLARGRSHGYDACSWLMLHTFASLIGHLDAGPIKPPAQGGASRRWSGTTGLDRGTATYVDGGNGEH